MAFPTTGLLDAFTRANENPLANGTWNATNPFGSGTLCKLLSNVATGAGSFGNSYWDAATFGADTEVYFTYFTRSSQSGCHLRLQSPGTAGVDGYEALLESGNTAAAIWRIDNGAETKLGANITTSYADGDSLGFEAIGSTLTLYKKTAGSWSATDNRSDATYGSAGNIGIAQNDTTGELDDYSGGTVVTAAGQPASKRMGGVQYAHRIAPGVW